MDVPRVPWPALAGALLLVVTSGCASEVSQHSSAPTSPGIVVKGRDVRGND